MEEKKSKRDGISEGPSQKRRREEDIGAKPAIHTVPRHDATQEEPTGLGAALATAPGRIAKG